MGPGKSIEDLKLPLSMPFFISAFSEPLSLLLCTVQAEADNGSSTTIKKKMQSPPQKAKAAAASTGGGSSAEAGKPGSFIKQRSASPRNSTTSPRRFVVSLVDHIITLLKNWPHKCASHACPGTSEYFFYS